MRPKSLIVTAFLVDFCHSTQHSNGKRIVGGKDAARGQYPAYGVPVGDLLCGATLIAPDLMLSAAHCKGSFTSGPSAVAIGGLMLNAKDEAEIVGVAYEVTHPDYDPNTAANDIMLVKLDMPSKAQPVLINDNPTLPLDGETVLAIGFGNTEFEGNVSPILQEVETNIVSHEVCLSAYQKVAIHVNKTATMCTGVYGGGKGSCQGDSGGPIFSQAADGSLVLVATVSWGKGCASAIYPGVNVRLSAFVAFIKEAICQLSDFAPAYCESNVGATPADGATFTSNPTTHDMGPSAGFGAAYPNKTDGSNSNTPYATFDFDEVIVSNATASDNAGASIVVAPSDNAMDIELASLDNTTTSETLLDQSMAPSHVEDEHLGALGNETSAIPPNAPREPSVNEASFGVLDTSFVPDSVVSEGSFGAMDASVALDPAVNEASFGVLDESVVPDPAVSETTFGDFDASAVPDPAVNEASFGVLDASVVPDKKKEEKAMEDNSSETIIVPNQTSTAPSPAPSTPSTSHQTLRLGEASFARHPGQWMALSVTLITSVLLR